MFLDLYLNLKFLSNPNTFALGKYLQNDAVDAPNQVPISNKLKLSFFKNSKCFS